ncbi:hypothetical protein [Cytobacillus purgationiresistens]|uniref:PBP1b-binding outer membrane lipoprotein LpoB n=1 Tax=Cytobacillus purgationiresistens TaxID=863449 RepID=A0ABU0AAG9_9BACI|nr:hypothetical protein [Cytobacillus purgationiresistens]MDQ0268238.1 PBP1b-binding outer membrane lipoprotein LpoB [Cytobacillus purgationiresistens]
MRKIWFLLLLAVFLTACSSDEATNGEKKEEPKVAEAKAEEEEKGVEVDKGLLDVEVTLPASMIEDEEIDSAISEAKEDGISDVIKNEDGSITYKMTKAQHKETMKEMETNLTEAIHELKTSDDYTSIKDVAHNKDFSEFTMEVEKETYENGFDSLATFGLGFAGMYYQIFDGAQPDNFKVKIFVKDEATQEIFDEIVYPDDLQEDE